MLKYVSILALLSCLSMAPAPAQQKTPTPVEALNRLMEGNSHFVKGEILHLSFDKQAKEKLLEKQTPFAAILDCSDSRVPPELIFDQGIGDLFVVRDAGNVLGPIEMDSLEFAVAKLNVPLVVVMGHQNCGAITAALNGKEKVPELSHIYPLIDKALSSCSNPKTKLTEAIYCNIREGVKKLEESPLIRPLLAQKKILVIGAYFDFDSGKVMLIPKS